MEDNNSTISLMLTSRGRFYWTIKFGFNMEKVDNQTILERIKDMDSKLTDSFPKNVKDTFAGVSRTANIEMFE